MARYQPTRRSASRRLVSDTAAGVGWHASHNVQRMVTTPALPLAIRALICESFVASVTVSLSRPRVKVAGSDQYSD